MKKIYAFLIVISSAFTFNAQCDYTLTMLDSWGDGWSGNTMDVLVNGSIVLDDATFASGASSDLTFSVSTADNITTLWNGGGSYDYECSWEIKDNTGNVVGTGDYQTPMAAVTAACPSCIAPSALLSSNITTTSADVSWTAGGTETAWNVEYGPSGFASGSGTTVASTSPSYSFSGLTTNTLYDVYVQADCGGGISSAFSSVASFRTFASSVTVPYSNDLETGNFGTDLAPTNNTYSSVIVSPGAANASNFGIQMNGGDNYLGWTGGSTTTTAAQAWGSNSSHVATVDIIVDASTVSVVNLDFDLKQTSSYGVKYSWFRVMANDTVQIGTDMNPVTDDADPFTPHTLDLSQFAGTTFKLSFQHSGKYDSTYNFNFGADMSLLDNIVLSAPSCNGPSGLATTNTTDVSSDLSWTAGGTETAWNVEYGAAGFTLGSGTTVAATATSYQFTGLTQNTSYDMYVQADCGGGSTSSMVGPISITTLPTAGTCGFFHC
jgi:hypothetical protein